MTILGIKIKKRFTPFQIIVLGFIGLMLVGCLLLMLPFSTVDAGHASFSDALFTATSAVCVTGLVVRDTATYWTWFGQLIILILIQIGGLGVVTVVVGFTMSFGRKIGLMQRNTMQAAISAPQLGGIMRLTTFIFKVTFVFELIGAVCLAPQFIIEFGFWKGVWASIFTSISAFCNAGFDLCGTDNALTSIMMFKSNIAINTIIMVLIITGGIGFTTWEDFRHHGLNLKKFRMQSKVILTITLALIVLPALFFYFYEFSLPQWDNYTLRDKILGSLFQSVAPRTAGFYSVDLAKFSQSSQLIYMFLMLIGGSPGSTAGGMKTTTIAVLLSTTFSVFRRKVDSNIYGRRIADETVKNAATIFMLYILLFSVSGIAISCIEKVSILTALFECASAIGTVGSSLGLTTSLCFVSRLIIIFLMFFGRVGGLTLIFATTSNNVKAGRLPEEKINVG